MKRLLITILTAMAVLMPAGRSHAQTCRSTPIITSQLNVDGLMLFSLQGAPVDRASKTSLPPRLDATDCGDANYVMIQLAKTHYLVRKSDLKMPKVDVGCRCRAASGAEELGTPGAGGGVYCEREAPQCRR